MLSEREQYLLKLNRIPEEDVESVSTDMLVTFKDGTQRRICEVWSRVMGYLRPTTDFNVGKYSEYESRKVFKEDKAVKRLNDNSEETPDGAA